MLGGSWFLAHDEVVVVVVVVVSSPWYLITKGKIRVVNHAYWHILQGVVDIEVVDR